MLEIEGSPPFVWRVVPPSDLQPSRASPSRTAARLPAAAPEGKLCNKVEDLVVEAALECTQLYYALNYYTATTLGPEGGLLNKSTQDVCCVLRRLTSRDMYASSWR